MRPRALRPQFKRDPLDGGGNGMADGYGFWWHEGYWASLSTGGRDADGRHDILFGPVPADTHGHVWVKFVPDQSPVIGSQLKDRGKHVGAESEGSFSTQALVRGRVERNTDGTITTQIAQIAAPSAYTAGPVTSDRTASSRSLERVELEVPVAARWFEFDLAVTGNRSSESSPASRLLPFGGSSPLAVRLTVTRWGA